jgi:hypothetical protein
MLAPLSNNNIVLRRHSIGYCLKASLPPRSYFTQGDLEWLGRNVSIGELPRTPSWGEVRRNPLGRRMNNRLIERGRE